MLNPASPRTPLSAPITCWCDAPAEYVNPASDASPATAVCAAHVADGYAPIEPARAVPTDTGTWHGPVEGFVSDDGTYAGSTTPNDIHSAASWRMAQRAWESRDVATLLFLAREATRAAAHGYAEHLRGLASIYSETHCVHGPVDLATAPACVMLNRAAVGRLARMAPAYDRASDMYVDVLAVRDGYAGSEATVDHPFGGVVTVPLAALDI